MEIKFIVNPTKRNINYSFFILTSSEWDDYNNRTTFYLDYFDHKNEQRINFGSVKIMHESNPATLSILPPEFNSLSDKFCSLGQSIEYYIRLKEIFNEDFESVLEALNDVAFFEGVKDNFDSSNGFRYSLIRQSSAEQALYNAKNTLLNIPFINEFKFTYTCNLKGAEEPHELNFNYGDSENIPNRIIVLIGKNGTGKTQFLANLALDLSGISRRKLKADVFRPQRPLFSKVIAVSYSIFDKFTKPKSGRSFSYKYCGLKDSNGRLISNKKMSANYADSIGKIILKDLQVDWYNILSLILDKRFIGSFYDKYFNDENTVIDFDEIGNQLSSGQSFLMYVITEVIANVKSNTLILFDEPEMHLHPNAIGNLIKMLNRLLERFESYALIATHSPIIIQEIPSRYVNVFEREGNIPMVYNLGIESFGENIEVLTQEVFKIKDVEQNYKSVLTNLSKIYSYNDILALFDNKLSLNAKTFLLAQYPNPESEINA